MQPPQAQQQVPRLNKKAPPIAATAPPAAPAPVPVVEKPKPAPRFVHMFERFLGTRAVATTEVGLVVEGEFAESRDGFYVFKQCRLTGRRNVAYCDELVLRMKDVSHMNSPATRIEAVDQVVPMRTADVLSEAPKGVAG